MYGNIVNKNKQKGNRFTSAKAHDIMNLTF